MHASKTQHSESSEDLIYALHGVREYWIVDLNGRCIVVHRRPDQSGPGRGIAFVKTGCCQRDEI